MISRKERLARKRGGLFVTKLRGNDRYPHGPRHGTWLGRAASAVGRDPTAREEAAPKLRTIISSSGVISTRVRCAPKARKYG
jgi:hypothetical protein